MTDVPNSSAPPHPQSWGIYEKSCLTAAFLSLAIGLIWLSWLKVSPIGTMLFMNYGVPHPEAAGIERRNAWILLAALPFLVLPASRQWAAGLFAGYLALVVFATVDQGGEPFSQYAPLAQAMRLCTPFVFMAVTSVWWQKLPAFWSQTLPLWVIMLATTLTFHMHGVEAIQAHPGFIDMTIGAANELTGWRPEEKTARIMLMVVGAIDIVAPAALLLLRSRPALLWLIGWGLFTSYLRFLNYESGGLPDAIVRLPHFFLPLALWRFTRWI